MDGKVVCRGWTVPEAIHGDYDVRAVCPQALNWSEIGNKICVHTGVPDWRYAERAGRIGKKWRCDANLAQQSLSKVRNIVENVENIRAMNDRGIEALIDALIWATARASSSDRCA